MCGIAGYWSPDGIPPQIERWATRAQSYLSHRGPEGAVVDRPDNMFVGVHTLLSFHDTASAAQPFRSPCGRFTALLNGEIYNYSSLRKDLERDGMILTTRSECELIITLYQQLGSAFVEKLRGMFALALYDAKANRLMLARDYIGKKPLYYTRLGRAIAFASELRPLLSVCDTKSLSPSALATFLHFNSVASDECLIANVKKLKPAEALAVDAAGLTSHIYWRTTVANPLPTEQGCLEAVIPALEVAVSRRLRTEGANLGLMLSGGLDSSLIAAIALEQGVALPCFTAKFDESTFDESVHASALANALGIPHHNVLLDDRTLAATAQLYLGKVDEPIADPSLIPILEITRQARGSVKGLLSGDGADDFFFGYEFFKAVPVITRLGRVISARFAHTLASCLRYWPTSDRNLPLASVLTMLSRAVGSPPEHQYYRCTGALSEQEMRKVVSREFWPVSPPLSSTSISSLSAEPVRKAQLGMLYSFLQAPILSKLDRGSMLNGVELRQPFLDQDLVELALRCPTRYLLGKQTKLLLRKIARAHLPAEIVDRRKQGFRIPMRRLLRGNLREFVLETLSPGRLRSTGVFQARAVERMLLAHLRGQRDLSKAIWAICCFQAWSANTLDTTTLDATAA